MAEENESTGSSWTFLTNHGHVLLSIAKTPDLRLRDIADLVGITERSAQGIIADLAAGEYIEIKRDGRCNIYTTRPEKHLRHPVESHKQVADLIGLIEVNGVKEGI